MQTQIQQLQTHLAITSPSENAVSLPPLEAQTTSDIPPPIANVLTPIERISAASKDVAARVDGVVLGVNNVKPQAELLPQHNLIDLVDPVDIGAKMQPAVATDVALMKQARPEAEATPLTQRPEKQTIPAHWLTGEFWLNKIGIVLVLLAVAFFFNYAVELGWFVPPLRVASGLLAGSLMLGFGMWLNTKATLSDDQIRKQNHLREIALPQVLMGGGIATFFITGYASLQLYDLVPYMVAMGFMALVTFLAYGLSVRHNSIALALIALSGGLMTPLVLSNGTGDVASWLAYNAVVLSCAALLYLWRGWQILFWFAAVSTYLITSLASAQKNSIALQFFIVFALCIFWLLPIARKQLAIQALAQRLSIPRLQNLRPLTWTNLVVDINLLTLFSIIVAVCMTGVNWRMSAAEFVWLTLGAALVCSVLTWVCYRVITLRNYLSGHLLSAVALFILSTIAFAPVTDWVLLALVLITAGLLLIDSKIKSFTSVANWTLYGMSIVIGLWLTGYFADALLLNGWLWPRRLSFDLLRSIAVLSGIIGLTAIGIRQTSAFIRQGYFILAYLFSCLWLIVISDHMNLGNTFTSLGLGLLGSTIFAIRALHQYRAWRWAGYATLFAAAALALSSQSWISLMIIVLILQITMHKAMQNGNLVLYVITHLLAVAGAIGVFSQMQFQLLFSDITTWTILTCILLLLVQGKLWQWLKIYSTSDPVRIDPAAYLITAYALGLFWLGQFVHQFGYRHALTTAIWGSVALAVLGISLYRNQTPWHLVGLATLVITVTKLCLLDVNSISDQNLLNGLMLWIVCMCIGTAWLHYPRLRPIDQLAMSGSSLAASSLLAWLTYFFTQQITLAALCSLILGVVHHVIAHNRPADYKVTGFSLLQWAAHFLTVGGLVNVYLFSSGVSKFDAFHIFVQLASLVLIFIVSKLQSHHGIRTGYQLTTYLGTMLMLAQFALLTHLEKTLLSGLWGIIALVLIVYGQRQANNLWRSIGFTTLAIVIGKLFLFDLYEAALLIKMIVFLFMGIALLTLSYFYRKLPVSPKV